MKTLLRHIAFVLALGIVACKGQKDRVLAVVDGKAVTQKEFDAYLKLKHISQTDPKRIGEALDQYLEREELARAIEEQKTLDPEMVQVELNEFKKEMLISRYFEKYLDQQVSDAAIKNFYESHAKDYDEKKVHVAHILIRTGRGMSETERQAKLTTARDVYSQLKAGKDFAALAEQYSEDKVSSKNGGDLGWLREGSVDPRFSKTAFEMQPGNISEPFETAFGFHIVKVLDGARTIEVPFAAKAGDIRYELRNKAKAAEVERLKALGKVEKKDPYPSAQASTDDKSPAKGPASATSVASAAGGLPHP